ncbi:hypothetical protein AVEN_127380-1 [Araneus ventricosus]|uniref:Uncharacterized protein n=1 Tax=Araneus ventricosus TaxID=182803 RepID=A0A4Y2ET49_ARAVE|nr:hypothetical protein AVEN_127380-1 [Araneus ventricosus]
MEIGINWKCFPSDHLTQRSNRNGPHKLLTIAQSKKILLGQVSVVSPSTRFYPTRSTRFYPECSGYGGRGGLVVRSRLWGRRAPGSKPDSTDDPPCMGPVAR